jgi:phosphate transport system permease protein
MQESKTNYKERLHDMMLRRSSRRKLVDKVVSIFAVFSVILAVVLLGSILIEVIINGAGALSINFLTQPPGAIGSGLGGIGPAIQGTLILVGISYWSTCGRACWDLSLRI